MTGFELAVIEYLLNGDEQVLSELRRQLRSSTVTERELTGAGFFTKVLVPEGMDVTSRQKTFKIGDVAARVDGLRYGAGFLLYVENGRLHMLEGYSYDEEWPSAIGHYELSYLPGPTRDIELLRMKWS